MKSILLKNGKILKGDKIVEERVLIADGKIRMIGGDISSVDEIIDLGGKLILPGLIDPHVHFREPGMTEKEDFLSGSMAAAAGGVTTILDMPNTKPATINVDALDQKRELALKSVVNYGFHFGASVDNLDEIKKAKNIASVKIFMDQSTGDMKMNDESAMKKVFKQAKIISVHAEGDNVAKAIDFVKGTKNKLYLCHLSTKEEIAVLKKNSKASIFGEVTPHHLFLTSDDESNLIKMKPSLKSKEDQEVIWKFLGKINTIGSDHAPHLLSEKESSELFGVPGVETTLPLLLNAFNEKKLKLSDVVRLCCENPAKFFNIENKGKLEEGYDADIVIVDLDMEKKISNSELFTKCKWSPWDGKVLKGWPVMTIVNGEIVFNNGKINDKIKGQEVKYAHFRKRSEDIAPKESSDAESEESV